MLALANYLIITTQRALMDCKLIGYIYLLPPCGVHQTYSLLHLKICNKCTCRNTLLGGVKRFIEKQLLSLNRPAAVFHIK